MRYGLLIIVVLLLAALVLAVICGVVGGSQRRGSQRRGSEQRRGGGERRGGGPPHPPPPPPPPGGTPPPLPQVWITAEAEISKQKRNSSSLAMNRLFGKARTLFRSIWANSSSVNTEAEYEIAVKYAMERPRRQILEAVDAFQYGVKLPDNEFAALRSAIEALPGWRPEEYPLPQGPKPALPVAACVLASVATAAGTFGPGRAPVFVLARTPEEMKPLQAVYAQPGEGERMVYVVLVDKGGDESRLLEAAGAVVGLRPATLTAGKSGPYPATGWLCKMGSDSVQSIRYLDRWPRGPRYY
jgi:hypothetical protein